MTHQHRAYSLLTVKAVQEDKRIIEGIATTPETDRVGDIVEPLGVQFKNPMPLLLFHQADKPVGTVRFAKPTKDGISFTARLPKIDAPGTLQDRVEEAWQSIKAGLIGGVSIGFRAIETSRLDDGGIRFIESEVLELSLVTIPANASATIQTIKSLDADLLAASGQQQIVVSVPPGASGQSKPRILAPKDAKKMQTIAERITGFEAKRAANAARMEEIQNKANEDGRTKDDAEKDEFNNLKNEIKSIDDELVDLREMEKLNVKKAVPVVNVDTPEKASESRGGGGTHVVVVPRKMPKGTLFTRYYIAKAAARHRDISPVDFARSVGFFDTTPELELILRAPVAAGTTTNSTWAGPLVNLENATGEFIEKLYAEAIIGRIPGLRRVPFNIKVPRETTAASVNWVGEGAVKPVSAMAFDSIELRHTKIAGIVPVTDELVRFSNPAVEGLVRDSLVAAVVSLMDKDFLDPTKAEVVGVSPASVTNGVTPVTATGTNSDALRADLTTMLKAMAVANMGLRGVVLVMTSSQAVAISGMVNALGQDEFPQLGVNGGTLRGLPVIISENIVATGGSPADGGLIVAINAPEVMLADDGGVDIDISREASLQMDTAPDSPETASTILVSLWQRNMVAIKAERFINWKKRRAEAVQFIQNAKYA